MSVQPGANISVAALIAVALLLRAQPVLACAVCVGDPGSPMVQGLQAGVLVLMGVVVTVLIGLASLLVFWMRRAANIERLSAEDRAG